MAEVTSPAGLAQIPIQDNWRLSSDKTPQMIRFQMAVADYDQDGLLDIAISSAGNNLLLHFEGGRFRPVTSRLGVDSMSRGKHVDISTSWLDYDNDGYPDHLPSTGRTYDRCTSNVNNPRSNDHHHYDDHPGPNDGSTGCS